MVASRADVRGRAGRMPGLLMLLLGVAALAAGPRPAAGQAGGEWVGRRVILQFHSVLRVGNQVVDNQKLEASPRVGQWALSRIYRVEQVSGPWIWIKAETEGVSGWVRAAEVIPYDQAIDHFTNQIRANPRNDSAYISRGLLWRDRKEYDIALADFSEAIRLDPGSEVGWINRGNVWSDKKEYDKALADYAEAIRLDPKCAAAYHNRGNAWRAKKEYDKALADYAEAIRLDPKYAVAYHNRGNAWSVKKEYDKALADYAEAIRLDPKYAAAYLNRGNAWNDKKEYDKALADYAEAIRLDPKYAHAYFSQSVAQMLLRRGEAVGGFRKVLDLKGWKGDLSVYAVILGHLAARRAGDDAAARAFLEDSAGKLDASAWPDPVVRFLRGAIDEPALLAAATDDDKRTEARCFLGLDHALKGHADEAQAHFRWVKEHGTPDFIEYTIALAELGRSGEPAGDAGPATRAGPR